MTGLLLAQGRFVARRPWTALAVVGVLTVIAGVGLGMTAEDADPEAAFLPANSEVVRAQDILAERFPQFAGLESMQVVLRGDVLTPDGAADAVAVTELMADDPALAPYRIDGREPTSPGHVLRSMLAGDAEASDIDLRASSPAEIQAAIDHPDNVELAGLLADLVARDDRGAVVGGIGLMTINDNDEPQALIDAQLLVDAAVRDAPLVGLESARTFSGGTIADGQQTTSCGDKTFAVIRERVDEIVTVTDAEIVAAMRFAFERLNIVLEPSGASAFAAVLAGHVDVTDQRVGVTLSGGNVDLDRFRALTAE